jgi:hypothetical protein
VPPSRKINRLKLWKGFQSWVGGLASNPLFVFWGNLGQLRAAIGVKFRNKCIAWREFAPCLPKLERTGQAKVLSKSRYLTIGSSLFSPIPLLLQQEN